MSFGIIWGLGFGLHVLWNLKYGLDLRGLNIFPFFCLSTSITDNRILISLAEIYIWAYFPCLCDQIQFSFRKSIELFFVTSYSVSSTPCKIWFKQMEIISHLIFC